MSSEFYIKSTSETIRKSFSNYDLEMLPQYTIDSLANEIAKGEKSFFTKGNLSEFKDTISKAEKVDNDSMISQIKKLEPIVINKSNGAYEVGYLLANESE